jgi:hypothetical protein
MEREPRAGEPGSRPIGDDLLPDANLEALYAPDYLAACACPDTRKERLEELRRRIRAGAYRVDAERLAQEMLERGDVR